jgi:alkane 1-monooxygenase
MQTAHPPGMVSTGRAAHVAFCLTPQLLFVLLGLATVERGYWFLLPSLFLLVVFPFLDLLTGWQDDANFQKKDFSPLQIFLLNWNTRLYAGLHVAAVIYFTINIHRYNMMEIGLLILCLSLLGGICFAAAHELLHAKDGIDQFLQRVTTSFLFYPHYKLIHIRGHHVHVGTSEDENTAWLNETIYAYIIRTIPGSAIRSWHFESRRFSEEQKLSGWGILRNQMFGYLLGQLAILLTMGWIAGLTGLAFYLAQLVATHFMLESVNYIQHYGLMRQEHEGEYERTAAEHSWDTYHFFSSYVTFRVGHHSYHHLAVKPYYLLASEPQAPKLPAGYFWSIAMVLMPPWWRRVINPRLKTHPQ